MLEQEFLYYQQHQSELVNEYLNRAIVIKGNKVIGSYDTQKQAYLETIKTEKPGTFLIQLCVPGTNSTTQVYHSQVILHAR